MSVFIRIIIALGLFLIVTSCAQVGTISGGAVDSIAPEVKRMKPENKTVHFNSQSIEIEFKDFIKLNNPNQTISVIPPDFKVITEIKGKTLFLSWTETLKENTTYSIFLNKTVKDLTEGNDSIMQIVFSTGDYLDSLTYTGFVKDALTGNAAKGILVGLFEAKDSLKPMYFAETDITGKALFSYVKKGNYYLRAFDDANKDLKISKTERVGFQKEPIQLDSSFIDSIPISIFTPALAPNINTFNFLSPGAFVVGSNRSLKDAKIALNDTTLSTEEIRFITNDSLVLLYSPGELKSVQLTVNGKLIDDTTTVRLTDASKNKPLNIAAPKANKVNPSEVIVFSVMDKIAQIDTSKIGLMSLPDSLEILDYRYELIGDQLIFKLNTKLYERIIFAFDEGAVIGKTAATNKQSFQEIKFPKLNELGILNLDLSAYEGDIVLEVLTDGKILNTIAFSENKKKQLTNLKPGDYTFKVIIDENQNGKWDTGDFEKEIQPEEIQLFSEPTKVRANWEVELIIVPKI